MDGGKLQALINSSISPFLIYMNSTARKAAALLVTLAVVSAPFASVVTPMAMADDSDPVTLDCNGSLGTPTVTATQVVSNDPDSGTFGGNWAYDNFTRTIKIWTLDSTHYCAQATDDGHFVTFGDSTGKSPQSGDALPDTVTGTMVGGTGMITINGTLDDSATIPSTIDCATDAATCANGLTNLWMNSYFGSTFEYANWSWVYTAKNVCFRSWTNAAAGNQGDIKDGTDGHCPEALNQHLTVDSGAATSTTLTGHHSNAFSVSNLPAHGTLTCGGTACVIDQAFDPADVTFTSDVGFSGDTQFDFTASNGDEQYDNDATIYIHVNSAVVVTPPPTPTQTSNTIVVTPSAMQGWAFVNDQVGGAGTGALVIGPATPPLGTGSAQLTATSTTDGQILVAPYAGITFADLATLMYSTYQAAPNTGNATAIALQFNVASTSSDVNATWQGRIVFEPYVNNGGAVIAGSWNTWNALNGVWWLTKPASFPLVACGQATPCSLATLEAAYPNIGVNGNPTLGAVLFKAGSNWSNFNGNVDKLVIGVTDGSNTNTTTYDFEPAVVTPPADTGSGDSSTPASVVTTSGGNGGGGGGYVASGPLSLGFVNTNTTGGGLVLGTSTEDTSDTTDTGCSTPLLSTFMRAGMHNSKDEVIKLQTFLNTQLGLNIPVTGFFGSQTTAGVNTFQIKYQNDVLSPWSAFGHDGHTPTGYVYKTTQHEINKLSCGNLNLPDPQLP
jgi:hypothetical protein